MPLKQVLVGAGEGVEALASALHLFDHHITVGAGIDGDLLEQCTQGALHDFHPGALITLELRGQHPGIGELQKGGATSRRFLPPRQRAWR